MSEIGAYMARHPITWVPFVLMLGGFAWSLWDRRTRRAHVQKREP